MLLDQQNYLYFVFATPIVQEFEKVNALFQLEKSDPQELFDKLDLHYKSLKSRLFDTRGNKKNIDRVDFGAKFLGVQQIYQ